MTAFGVIPPHPPAPDYDRCFRCGGTGWAPVYGPHGDAYEEPCPDGCPQPELPPVDQDQEAPF